ncbi:hypothetical protein H0H87_008938 [Tephrocybe sp. NHM501043]|nr:hypothetical protein H0H87_008938 [Tephrocybe sp. NHM501043]
MPPKKRARKHDAAPPAATEEPVSKLPLPPGANTGMLFDLPAEVWLEIISHFTSVRIPTLQISSEPLLPSSTLERQEALRALSQTCRHFRALFLPELWDRVEVCASKNQKEVPKFKRSEDVHIRGTWYKTIANALETRSNGLKNSPEHAQFVHTVSVALSRYQHVAVLSSFVQCLLALPNLHTIQILRAHTEMTTHLKNAFEGHTIRQVQTIVLPDHAHNVLRSCPEVRSVMCNYGDGGKLVSAIQKVCKKVERLDGFKPDDKLMKRLVKAVPNLQEIRFGRRVELDSLAMLSTLKHLRLIELDVEDGLIPHVTKCIELAKELLRKTKDRGVQKPCLRLRHSPSRGIGWVEEIDLMIA